MSKKILVVEDEPNLGVTLAEYLKDLSYDVELSQTCKEAKSFLPTFSPHLVLLDINLPDGSGLELAKKILASPNPPAVIFLSAMNAPEIRLEGFELGAYDYINKPFSLKELTHRLNKVFSLPSTKAQQKQQYGLLEIDLEAFTLTDGYGEQVHLSHKECAILKLLLKNMNQALSRESIIEEVWGEDQFPSNRTVDNYIVKLRKWCETDPNGPLKIKSIRGVGYKLYQENKE